MAPFTASLYHREMKNAPKFLKCSKCLEVGHLARQCHKDIVCWACKETGHRESECPYDKSKEIGSDEDNETSASDESEKEAELETKMKSGDKNTAKSSKITKHSTNNEGDTKKEETKY
ncbi:zinc finger protein GIS2 [Elysia marginata]|uniref:Zinc finger protein GIS2 n=1 Tax=Elysia marginata TaxID=1093978 RepID=A0AAV4GS71_9GAST|nr:zinc finger protein GIS2 [Elysia marginata]